MSLKEEIKKAAASETVKIVIQSLLPLTATLILALLPQVRDQVWPAIPKLLLGVLLVVSLSVNFALVPFFFKSRRKINQLQASPPPAKHYPMFNVLWDEQVNPLCPVCHTLLSFSVRDESVSVDDKDREWHYYLTCPKCKTEYEMLDHHGTPVALANARYKLSKKYPTIPER